MCTLDENKLFQYGMTTHLTTLVNSEQNVLLSLISSLYRRTTVNNEFVRMYTPFTGFCKILCYCQF